MPWRSTLGGCPWPGSFHVAVASAGARKGRLCSPEPASERETAKLCCYRDKGSEQTALPPWVGVRTAYSRWPRASCVLDGDTATGLSFLFSGSSLPLLVQNPGRKGWHAPTPIPASPCLPTPAPPSFTSCLHLLRCSLNRNPCFPMVTFLGLQATVLRLHWNTTCSLLQWQRVEGGDHRAIPLQESSGMGRGVF